MKCLLLLLSWNVKPHLLTSQNKNHTMKNLFIKLVAAMALGGGLFILVQACTETEGKGSAIPKRAEPIPVKIISLEKSDSEPVVVTSGRLTTDDETILGFKTGGVV